MTRVIQLSTALREQRDNLYIKITRKSPACVLTALHKIREKLLRLSPFYERISLTNKELHHRCFSANSVKSCENIFCGTLTNSYFYMHNESNKLFQKLTKSDNVDYFGSSSEKREQRK